MIKNKVGKPYCFTKNPPINGKLIGKMLPAPDKPVYRALFLLLVTSSKTPLITIL